MVMNGGEPNIVEPEDAIVTLTVQSGSAPLAWTYAAFPGPTKAALYLTAGNVPWRMMSMVCPGATFKAHEQLKPTT
jgi:hypothetical protein